VCILRRGGRGSTNLYHGKRRPTRGENLQIWRNLSGNQRGNEKEGTLKKRDFHGKRGKTHKILWRASAFLPYQLVKRKPVWERVMIPDKRETTEIILQEPNTRNPGKKYCGEGRKSGSDGGNPLLGPYD